MDKNPYCTSRPRPWCAGYLRNKTLHNSVFHSLSVV